MGNGKNFSKNFDKRREISIIILEAIGNTRGIVGSIGSMAAIGTMGAIWIMGTLGSVGKWKLWKMGEN